MLVLLKGIVSSKNPTSNDVEPIGVAFSQARPLGESNQVLLEKPGMELMISSDSGNITNHMGISWGYDNNTYIYIYGGFHTWGYRQMDGL